jgi:hypothetical protein
MWCSAHACLSPLAGSAAGAFHIVVGGGKYAIDYQVNIG